MILNENKKSRILILDDDLDFLELLSDYFSSRCFEVKCFSSVLSAEMELLNNTHNHYDIILTDFTFPNGDGLEFIAKVKKYLKEIPIILLTGKADVKLAMDALEKGAFDFILKPIQFKQLSLCIERALLVSKMTHESIQKKLKIKSEYEISIIAKSKEMLDVLALAYKASKTNSTILISGESGTGKEIIAKYIHHFSDRSHMPFIAINCSAIPENLLESELFGHAKGAFTGAEESKVGLFEEADGGTLFLDEIGDLNPILQSKLLRVLQEKKLRRVGENTTRTIDVRIISATHQDLKQSIKKLLFREDLFFRLNVIPILIPPLRERVEDIIPLSFYFLEKYKMKSTFKKLKFSKETLLFLLKNKWVGNVRELENMIERAIVMTDSDTIDAIQMNFNSERMPEKTFIQKTEKELEELINISCLEGFPLNEYNISRKELILEDKVVCNLVLDHWITLDALENLYIKDVLNSVGGIKEKAAKVLNVDRKTLYRKLLASEIMTSS